jgi:hypothetical protein
MFAVATEAPQILSKMPTTVVPTLPTTLMIQWSRARAQETSKLIRWWTREIEIQG